MLGGLGNLTGLFKQAKELQQKLGDVQSELQAMRHEGEAGGGAVVATVNGKGTLVDIKIQPDAAGDVELLEDLIKSAVGVAAEKAHESAREAMAGMTGGINIPGLSDILGNLQG